MFEETLSPFKDAVELFKESTVPPIFDEVVEAFKKTTLFENIT